MIRQLRRGTFAVDIVGRARTWFTISGVVIAVSLGSLGIFGLNGGLEFRGGTAFELAAETSVSVTQMRDVLAEAGAADATVQKVGDAGFLVQSVHLDEETHTTVLTAIAEAAGIETSDVNVTDVGPKWGQQITSKAIRAFIIFLVVAVVYISFRLEPKMAGAAIVAMFHDMIVTAGVYAVVGFVVTPATVIAVLTILGYSLYDTVVIFDRVRERTANLSASGGVTFSTAVNESVNHVLVRSLNTSITSLMPVGSLLFVGSYLLGAETLRELALALFIGLSAGTYSSLFVATPMLAVWKEREDRWASVRARVAARSGGAAAPERHEPAAQPPPAAPSHPLRPPTAPTTPQAQPRGKRKKR